MAAKKRMGTFTVKEQQMEGGNTVSGSSLYFDLSLIQRENFLRYLVALVLDEH